MVAVRERLHAKLHINRLVDLDISSIEIRILAQDVWLDCPLLLDLIRSVGLEAGSEFDDL